MEIVAEAGDGRAALAEIQQHQPGRRAPRLQAAGARRRRGHERRRPRRGCRRGSCWSPPSPTAASSTRRSRPAPPASSPKEARREQIVDAVLACARGENVVPPDIAAGLVSEIRLRKQTTTRPALTQREQEILRLIAAGKSLPEIAKELYLGLTTVKTHVQHLYEKLGVSDRAAAVAERDAARPDRVARCRGATASRRRSRRGAAAEAERVVAWLRLPAIALAGARARASRTRTRERDRLPHRARACTRRGAPACSRWVYVRPVDERLALVGHGASTSPPSACSPLPLGRRLLPRAARATSSSRWRSPSASGPPSPAARGRGDDGRVRRPGGRPPGVRASPRPRASSPRRPASSPGSALACVAALAAARARGPS